MSTKYPFLVRYFFALATVVGSILLRMVLMSYVGSGLPLYITYYPAITIAALIGGTGPGLLATITIALFVDYWLLPPAGILHYDRVVDMVGQILFTYMGAFISIVAGMYRKTRDSLEDLVAQRTASLSVANEQLKREIEGHMLSEEALRQGEVRLNRSQAMAHLGSWELDLASKSLTMSDELYRIFGLNPREFGSTYGAFLDSVHPDDRNAVSAAISLCDVDDDTGVEHRIVRRTDGEVRIVLEKCNQVRDESGRAIRTIGMVQDITERKKAEEALHASETRYRTLFEAAREGILILDADTGQIVDINPFLVSMLGYSRDVFLGRKLWEIGFFNDIASSKEAFLELQTKGYARYENIPLKTKEGKRKDVEFVSNVYLVDHTKVIQCNIRDITERKAAEDRIMHLNSLLRSITDVSQLIANERNTERLLWGICSLLVKTFSYKSVWIAQADGGAKVKPFASSVSAEDYPKKTWVGRSEFPMEQGPSIKAIEARQTFIVQDTSTDPNFEPWRQEANKNGYASMISSPIIIDDNVWGTINIYSEKANSFDEEEISLIQELSDDISSAIRSLDQEKKRKEADEALIKSKEELEAANRELENYTYVVSHDLKEPLRSIEGFSQFLKEDYSDKLGDTGGEYLDRIVKASGRMSNLITDLLTLSRIGHKDVEYQRVNINKMMKGIEVDLAEMIKRTNGRIVYQNLPTILCQPTWMTEVFRNLISNGLKFNKDPEPTVTIACEEKAGEYEFSVTDNGIGIEQKYFDRIFKLFERLHSRKEYEGSGAGLAIVKSIIMNHKGRIWVEASQAGKGTTFKFTLPKDNTPP